MKILNEKTLKSNIENAVISDIEAGFTGGVAISVMQDNELVYESYIGNADEEKKRRVDSSTLFRLASMTKPVTAVAAMLLVERGMLTLDTPIAEILPEYGEMFVASFDADKNIVRGKKADTKITVKHILTHTSGIGTGEIGASQVEKMPKEDLWTLDATVKYFSEQGLAFEPFSAQAYSAFAAFDVMTKIIELRSGQRYDEFLRNNVFLPCDMSDTGFVPTDEQWRRLIWMHRMGNEAFAGDVGNGCVFYNVPCTHFLGGAGLISSLSDYTKFAKMLLNEGEYNGNRVLSRNSVELISTPHVPQSLQKGSARWGLGVRVIVDDNTLPVGSFGWSGAFGTHFWIDPQNRIAAVFMRNSLYDGGAGSKRAILFEKKVYSSFKN